MADVGTLEREELLAMDAPPVIEVRGNRAVGFVAGHWFRELERFEGLVHGLSPERSVGDRGWTGFFRGQLRHEGRELADEPGLLRAHERLLEDFAQGVDGDDLDLPLILVLEQDVLHVRPGNDDSPDPEFRRGLDLRGHAADGQNLPADAQGSRHRDALVHGDFLEGADDGRRDGDRGAVAFGPLAGADELDMDVVVRDVLARVLLDEGRDVLDRFLRDLPESPRGDDSPALLRLRGRHLRGDRVIADQDREAVYHAHDGAFRDERLVLLPPFDHPVRDLLLEGTGDAFRVEHMLRGHEGRRLFLGDVPGDADQAAQLPESEGQLSAATRPALRLPEDLQDRRAIKVWDLAVLRHLLGDEPNELQAVLIRVEHRGLHVDLVAVPADPRPERRMHPLDRVQVPRGDEDEVARDRLRLHHGAGGPF